ncbi:arrestin domain-containing protein 3-like [Sitophilus oryzae]|uniref:Arrestin domain-containing protein 3-like n=1 Tax=Sitophilus oryzae TaxID=7048 RepID=A0A6J2XCT8_SITOR|nr:arrestin domain-containing protein 3-like [Sitophilus oryzae]
MSNIQIQFNNTQLNTGDTITGKLVCMFSSPKNFRKLYIRLKCKEHTSWTDSERYYDHHDKKHKTRYVNYTGTNTLFYQEVVLHGEGSLSAGHHVFPFSVKIPEHLPSSFVCSYGFIKHSIKGTMDRPWKLDLEDYRELQVMSPIKLSTFNSHIQEAVNLSDDKTLCCCCCASGPITLCLSLEKQGFVVGESINVKVYCLNMSNSNVNGITVIVKSNLDYKTTHPGVKYKHDSELVSSTGDTGVGAHGEREYNFVLDIPQSTPVYNFAGCDLFRSSHELKVCAAIPGMHNDFEIEQTIYLGHIPFNTISPIFPQPGFNAGPNVPIMPMPMPMPSNEGATAPVNNVAPSAPPKLLMSNEENSGDGNANELPPPSYNEAIQNTKINLN